jgi:hypothetical protein
VEPVQGVASGRPVTLTVGVYGDASRYHYQYFITGINSDANTYTEPEFYATKVEEIRPGQVRLRAPANSGVYRVYAAVDDGAGNVAIADRSVTVEFEPQ